MLRDLGLPSLSPVNSVDREANEDCERREEEVRRERQRAGIDAAKDRGVYQGRKAGTTKAKPERARELAGRGLKHGEIATALGVSRRTVIRYLTPN